MNNVVSTIWLLFLIGSSSVLQATRKPIISQMGSKYGNIGPGTYELAALERLEKSPLTYYGRNGVTPLVPSFLDGSSLFLRITIPTIKFRMGLNFGKIRY